VHYQYVTSIVRLFQIIITI